MDALWQDLKFALRLLARSPGFFFTAVVALALGIGANTAVFSVVHGVLLKPLPYPEPGRLAQIIDVMPEMPSAPCSYPEYVDWRDHNRVFETVGASSFGTSVLSGLGDPERIVTVPVTASLFPVFGVRPALGRWFTDEEDRPGGPKVVMISDTFWRHRLGGDPAAVGRTITLDDVPRTIVGVMPDGFSHKTAAAWVPLGMAVTAYRAPHRLSAYGRLKTGMSLEQARRDMTALAARLAKAHGSDHGAKVESYRDMVVGDAGRPLLVLLGSVAFVLLIACANVANLLLSRATGRRREMALRSALGGTRLRLARQLLTESLIVSLTGGALGLGLAWAGVRAFVAAAPPVLPRLATITVDGPVLAFTLAVAVLTGLIFGLAPVLQLRVRKPAEALAQESGRTAGGRAATRAGSALVVAEIALSVVLLVGAGLMVKSLLRLQGQDLGISPERVLTFNIGLPATRYRTDEQVTQFYSNVLERVRALPGVVAAGATNMLPVSDGTFSGGFEIEGRAPWKPEEAPIAEERLVDGGYYKAMGIRLLRGRLFTEQDDAGGKLVVLVNQTLARRFFPNEDPIGKRLTYGSNGMAEIVGVTADVRLVDAAQPAPLEIAIPFRQGPSRGMALAVRTASDPAALLGLIRREVAAVDPSQPLSDVQTMNQRIGETLARPRLLSGLISGFAALAALLAAVGVYGLVSYAVSQQTREFGIRIALGADPRAVLAMVLRRGLRLAAVGVALGAGVALGVSRLLTSMLYEVAPGDPIVMAAGCAGVLAATMLACLIPARSATKVDPIAALRA